MMTKTGEIREGVTPPEQYPDIDDVTCQSPPRGLEDHLIKRASDHVSQRCAKAMKKDTTNHETRSC